MVSRRCKIVLQTALEAMNISFTSIELGEAEIKSPLSNEESHRLNEVLLMSGLELLNDHKSILSEKIKTIIIELIQHLEDPATIKFSHYLSQKLNHNYTYLSNIFSEMNKITIEHFLIINKIEKVKELITYGELNLTQIASKMNYSSVAHLSAQFKKVTGLNPSVFKQNRSRSMLEDL